MEQIQVDSGSVVGYPAEAFWESYLKYGILIITGPLIYTDLSKPLSGSAAIGEAICLENSQSIK